MGLLGWLLNLGDAVASDNRYWVGNGTSTDWETDANWNDADSGSYPGNSATPTSASTVYYNAGSGDCTLTANASAASITKTAGYTGSFDSDTLDMAVGDVTLDGAGTWDMGSGTWTISGNLDHAMSGTFTRGSASIVMTGTSKTILWGLDLNSLVVNAGASISAHASSSAQCDVVGNITVNGSLSIPSGKTLRGVFGGTLAIGSSGTLTGAGAANFQGTGYDITVTSGGTLDIASLTWDTKSSVSQTQVISGVIASAEVVIGSGANDTKTDTVQLNTATFTGNVTYQMNAGELGTLAIDMATHNTDVVYQGDVTRTPNSGTITYTKGTGSLTLSGTAAQSVDLGFGSAVEDIIVNKSAETVTLTASLSCESFVLTDGTLDIDGNDITTVSSGDFTQAAGTTCQDTAGGGLITVVGNFAVNGASGNECVWNGPDLAVTGTAVATYTTATNSDASVAGGTEIDATDNGTDGTGNTNWNFTPLVVVATAGPDYTFQADRQHYTLREDNQQYQLPIDRQHYTISRN